ncbi:MAG: alpha/beta fold hydrolase [Ferruginibacter sp.]
MKPSSYFLTTTNEHQTPIYTWIPPGEIRCILHIAHGMAEYALRYESIVPYFLKEQIAVFAHDHRGHGRAVPSIAEQGIVTDQWFNDQVEDIGIIVAHIKKEHPNKKIILLGHSMGSFVGQRFFQLHGHQINGLILSASNGKKNPLIGFGIVVAKIQKTLFGNQYRSNLINYLSFAAFNKKFAPNRTTSDWLSRDENKVDKYVTDEQCGFVCSSSFFYYFFKGIQDTFDNNNIRQIPSHVPVYALAGDKDPVGLQGKGFLQLIENWKAAGANDLTYDLYKGGRHEMMNETNRTEVLENIINWIKRVTP